MYTLEQIKAFTPQERNEFIDIMVDYLKKGPQGYFYILERITDYSNSLNTIRDYYKALNIPIANAPNFTNQQDRISFLKSIKTAECPTQNP